jgi:hypothetical protein
VHPTLGAAAGAFVNWRLGFFHGNPIWPIQEPTQRCGQSIVSSLASEDGASTTGLPRPDVARTAKCISQRFLKEEPQDKRTLLAR